jgi:hypothetical protein
VLDLNDLVRVLARKTPVFHAEADFQHALAGELHERHPSFPIRLEHPSTGLGKRAHVGIWLTAGNLAVAIEPRYFTRALSVQIGGEAFSLADRAARDLARYDFLKDIVRVETLLHGSHAATGYALLLTNDRGLWEGPGGEAVGASFTCREGHEINGALDWSGRASEGTVRGREQAIIVRGAYRCLWRDYSLVAGGSGTFRYLLIGVSGLGRVA